MKDIETIKNLSKEQILSILKDTLESYEELQARIDKAIEYIESYLPNYDFDKSNLRELLEILKGSDKE